MSTCDPGDVLGRLFDEADDYELATLDSLAIRAGLIWQCPGDHWNNREGEQNCGSCGKGRDELTELARRAGFGDDQALDALDDIGRGRTR